MKTAKDCPVNCQYLMMDTFGCGCEMGTVTGAKITERDGGETRLLYEKNKGVDTEDDQRRVGRGRMGHPRNRINGVVTQRGSVNRLGGGVKR